MMHAEERRMTYVAIKATMFELDTSFWVKFRSFLIVILIWPDRMLDIRGTTVLQGQRHHLLPMVETHTWYEVSVRASYYASYYGNARVQGATTHHDQKAIRNPNHEKKNTRP